MANSTNYLLDFSHANVLDHIWNLRLSTLPMKSNNKVYSEKSFQESLQNKSYVKGNETKYFILTVKKFLDNNLSLFQYNVLLIEDHQILKDIVIEDKASK